MKASADAADEYRAVIADQGSHVSGILTASLARRDAGDAADERCWRKHRLLCRRQESTPM